MSSKKKKQQTSPTPAVPLFEEDADHEKGQTIVIRSAVLAASTVVVLGGIKIASPILSPILLALFITIILLVPLRWLQSKGCSEFAAFLIVGFSILLAFGGVGLLLGNSIDDFIHKAPVYTEKVSQNLEKLENTLHKYGYTFWDPESKATEIPENDEASQNDEKEQNARSDPQKNQELGEKEQDAPNYAKLDVQTVANWTIRGVKELRHLAENALVVLIILMFMIFEAARFPAKLQKAFGKSPITNEHFQKIVEEVRRYVLYKGMSNLLSVFLVTVFYYFIGVKYAILWGLIAFFLYFIPNIGSVIATIPPLLIVFIDQGLSGAITLLIGVSIIEMVVGYGIEPRLLGHGLGISTVVVFLSLIFWGWMLGPVGLFLAAPLTIIVKIILQTFEETRWIAVLLSEKVPRD